MSRRAGTAAIDAACVVLSLAFAALLLRFGDATADPPAALPWPVDATLGALCCLALWWRRRRPLAVAVAITVVGAVAATATAAAAVAVYTVATRRRATVAIGAAAANVAAVTVYYLMQDDPKFPIWVDFAVRGLVLAAAVGWGMFARAQRALIASLVDQARLTERTRIAREMHDVLAHRLSLVSLHAGALEVRTDARPDEVATAAGVIRENAHEALQELRAVIGVLRTAGVPERPERPQPGLADVPELIETARSTGTRVGYECPVDAAAVLPAAIGRTAYRIVQEGLTNARKHAPGAEVDVRVDGAPSDGLRVRVTNQLTAMRTELPGAGAGLVGLRERVTLAGGRLDHGPVSHRFELEAWLPWPA
jgi:signal transduction histidine kinase